MVPPLVFSPSALADWESDTNELELDLDIRVIEHPSEVSRAAGVSDYLTCKTDSTCDDSNAC
jgi:hypothetical protein